MLIAIVPLILAVVGVLTYALAANAKVADIGRIVFWTSFLALVLSLTGKFLRLG